MAERPQIDSFDINQAFSVTGYWGTATISKEAQEMYGFRTPDTFGARQIPDEEPYLDFKVDKKAKRIHSKQRKIAPRELTDIILPVVIQIVDPLTLHDHYGPSESPAVHGCFSCTYNKPSWPCPAHWHVDAHLGIPEASVEASRRTVAGTVLEDVGEAAFEIAYKVQYEVFDEPASEPLKPIIRNDDLRMLSVLTSVMATDAITYGMRRRANTLRIGNLSERVLSDRLYALRQHMIGQIFRAMEIY